MDESRPSPPQGPRYAFFAVGTVLIATFLWRLFTPGTGNPSRLVQTMTMAFDAAMLIGIIGVRRQALMVTPEGAPRRFIDTIAVLAVVAGVGLFAIRFLGGDSAWWTGHWTYAMRPR